MLYRQIARASPARLTNKLLARRLPLVQQRTFLPDSITGRDTLNDRYPDYPELTEAEDPGQNGGYINPPRVKRQHRDPYGDWWDMQERRNYAEPVHEDHDVLGMLSPYDYTWTTPKKGAFMIACCVAVFLTVLAGVKATYPDRVSYPREFEGGLQRELGGRGAVRARKAGDPDP